MKYLSLSFVILLFLVGCLKTRAELKSESNEPELSRQTARLQVAQGKSEAPLKEPARATTAAQLEEIQEQMRNLNGRIDVVENQLSQSLNKSTQEKEAIGKEKSQMDLRFTAHEEALKKLEEQVLALQTELQKIKTQEPAKPDPKVEVGAKRNGYEEGEILFGQRKWREAILAYERYRTVNPRGKRLAESTYKIGVCFQELGLKDESRAFYGELLEKFPKSPEAKKAQTRLKSLK